MAITNNWDFSAFDLEKFANHVARVAQERDKLMDWMGIVRDMRDAHQAQIPVLQARTATEVDQLEDRLASTGTTEKSKRLQHYDAIEATEILPWEQFRKIPWNMQAEYAERLATAVVKAKMNRFVRFMAGSVSASTPDHVVEADVEGLTGTPIRDFIVRAGRLLDEQEVAEGPENRICFLAPIAFTQLYTVESVVRKDWGNIGGVRRFPTMYEYGGFTIASVTTGFNDSTLPGAAAKTPGKYRVDTTGISATGKSVYGVAWAKETLAQGFATDGPLSRIEIMPPTFVPQYKGWMLNAALIWDTLLIHEEDATGHAGSFVSASPDSDPGLGSYIIRLDDNN